MTDFPQSLRLDVKRIKEPKEIDYMCSETSSAMLLTDLGVETTPEGFYRSCSLQYGNIFYNPCSGWMGFDEVLPCINKELKERGKEYTCKLENLKDINELKELLRTTKKPVLVSVFSQFKDDRKQFHTFPVVGYDDDRKNIIYHETEDSITRAGRIIDNTYARMSYELLDDRWRETNRKAIYCTSNTQK